MIAWFIAALLGLATGLRVGWTLFHKRSTVSTGMIVSLGSLAFVATLTWSPAAILVDRVLHWPNVSFVLAQMGIVGCAVGSAVMITSMSARRSLAANARWEIGQYIVAGVVAVVSLALFLSAGKLPQRYPAEFIAAHSTDPGVYASWLLPAIYSGVMMTIVIVLGLRYANASQRGRGLIVFTLGIAVLAIASMGYIVVTVSGGSVGWFGTGGGVTIIALGIVAIGSLLPSAENWIIARRELRLLQPLWEEMRSRHPDLAIGTRPRGPMAFQVADQMAYISDALFMDAHEEAGDEVFPQVDLDGAEVAPGTVTGEDIDKQAQSVAHWVAVRRAANGVASGAVFPGLERLHQPTGLGDRDWILAIAHAYRRELHAP